MTVFNTIAIVIIYTPIWVWALYAILLFLGFQRTRDNTVPLWRMLILPTVVALLTISSFIGTGLDGVPAAVVGIAIGAVVGWQLERDRSTARQPDGRVWLRGEWLSFFQLLLVLLLRYSMNVVAYVSPALAAETTWYLSTTLISTCLSAMFLGRTAARLRTYFSSVRVASI